MEQESGQDPENDRPAGSQPPDSSHPGAGSPGPGPGPGAASSGSPGADGGIGDGDDGESVFGPWDALEGTLGAAKEREELLAGFAPGGVWDHRMRRARAGRRRRPAAGPDWRCSAATGQELIGLLRRDRRRSSRGRARACSG